jgi:hypothetical protein
MQNKIWSIIIVLLVACSGDKQSGEGPLSNYPAIPFDENQNATATYSEIVAFYEQLAAQSPVVHTREMGNSDAGPPLHEVVITRGAADPAGVRTAGKIVVLINNGIHPGEPCGIDASMLLARELASKAGQSDLLDRVAIVILPVYNIGGAISRSGTFRANQNGPEQHGFRGNAKNLDLNRDFIKCDSRNAQSFVRWFVSWSPELFIDTHTSNGADYQYVMTLIETQRDKLNPVLSSFMTEKITPQIYERMEKGGHPTIPYVYAQRTPEEGIASFLDLPRYSTGLAALHQTIGYTSEAHMLKPYADRVKATKLILESCIDLAAENKGEWLEAKAAAVQDDRQRDTFAIQWTLDTERQESLTFAGYRSGYKPSVITGQERLFYDQNDPYEKEIPYWPHYKATAKVVLPKAYVLPQAYREVAERLIWNGVQMEPLPRDTTLDVLYYYIEHYRTTDYAYEGHYLHSGVTVREERQKANFLAGDWLIPCDQDLRALLAHTLDPRAPDAYFAWNFFDGILMQKEYFSAYVFEDLAAELLESDPALREVFEARRALDADFAKNSRAQLDFIYKRSPYYEPTHMRYPVARIE